MALGHAEVHLDLDTRAVPEIRVPLQVPNI